MARTLSTMNALALRDQLFSALHVATLKPLGYRKRGHWLIRDCGALAHAFYLRASRFGSQTEAIFWIDVQIFNADWHRLVFPERPYKGPSEGPCLSLRELGNWSDPPMRSFQNSSAVDVERLFPIHSDVIVQMALPYLEQRTTPEALLDQLVANPEPHAELTIVGLSRLLGHEAQARKYMEQAKQKAAHDNELRFLELRERNIWRALEGGPC